MSTKSFRTRCMCGCGDGIEMTEGNGRIAVSFFRDDSGAKASILKERADYAAGKNLLREIMMDRATFSELLEFLSSVELDGTQRGGANKSHLAPTHLLDDIYAVWLQGTMPVKAVFGGAFRDMFKLELTAMDRDVLVVQMRSWLAQEKVHAIPEGVSPHVDRLAGTQAPKKKVPSKDEAKAAATTALKSVRAAAKAAMDAARHTADPKGADMEDELYGTEPDVDASADRTDGAPEATGDHEWSASLFMGCGSDGISDDASDDEIPDAGDGTDDFQDDEIPETSDDEIPNPGDADGPESDTGEPSGAWDSDDTCRPDSQEE